MSHTKEPWIIVPGGRLGPEVIITTQHRLDGRKAEICGMDVEFTGHHGDEQKANTRRIVDCVNACAGIATEKLEGIKGNSLLQTAARVMNIELIQQRDELLAALEEACVCIGYGSIPEVNLQQMADAGHKTVISLLNFRKLIASAKGGA